MALKKVCDQLNLVKECKKYDLSLWQCPQFLFLVMGVIIIFSTLTTYAIGNRYIDDPLLVALIVLLIGLILFIIAATITKNFEKLAEANRMKSEFISIVSHQLRSPIANLKWVIEFLMSGRISPVSEKQIEYFRILKENSQRMGELVSDLLTVSRIEQGRLFLKKERISLQNLTKKAIKETEIFIMASNVEVKLDLEENLSEITADANQIALVIGNLLDNAIRYTKPPDPDIARGEKKEGKIEISLKEKNNNLYFEIKDNGIGIPKKDQKYIFQKFFRSGNIKRYQTEGSGLGLYIAKSIIEKSGGKMGFGSQEGVGSTFWFILPLKGR